MMHLRSRVLVFAALILAACATPLNTARVSAEAVLLQGELTTAYATIGRLPLSDSEAALLRSAMIDLNAITAQLDGQDISYVETLNIALSNPSQYGRNLLDETVAAYQMAKLSYVTYLERTGATADPFLLRYDRAATDLYHELDRDITTSYGRTDYESLRAYLVLVLRAISVFRA